MPNLRYIWLSLIIVVGQPHNLLKSLVYGLLMIMALLSCKVPDVAIQGSWERVLDGFEITLTFDEENHFWLQVGEGSQKVEGIYQVSGKSLTLVDDDCGEAEGIYTVDLREQGLIFSNVDDACTGRMEVLQGDWMVKE